MEGLGFLLYRGLQGFLPFSFGYFVELGNLVDDDFGLGVFLVVVEGVRDVGVDHGHEALLFLFRVYLDLDWGDIEDPSH